MIKNIRCKIIGLRRIAFLMKRRLPVTLKYLVIRMLFRTKRNQLVKTVWKV